MSEYVLGRLGFVMTTTFFVFGLGIGSLAIALRRALVLQKAGKLGLLLLWVAVLGLVGAGLFPADPGGDPVTTTGILHVVFGILALPPLGVGLILVSFAFRRDELLRSITPVALALGAIFFNAFFSIMFVFDGGRGAGLAQRTAIGALLIWMTLVGNRTGAA